MQKYNIKYSPYLRQIIIPHYDITNRLVGIRGRMMTEEDEERYGKYSPIKVGDIMYKHFSIHRKKRLLKFVAKVKLRFQFRNKQEDYAKVINANSRK